jgi:hypothetical protein
MKRPKTAKAEALKGRDRNKFDLKRMKRKGSRR